VDDLVDPLMGEADEPTDLTNGQSRPCRLDDGRVAVRPRGLEPAGGLAQPAADAIHSLSSMLDSDNRKMARRRHSAPGRGTGGMSSYARQA
jgi:hypothetical protein